MLVLANIFDELMERGIADRSAIISSDKIFSHSKFERDSLQDFDDEAFPQTGTCVIVDLSNRKKNKTTDIFDEYEDEAGKHERCRTENVQSRYAELTGIVTCDTIWVR